MERASMDGETGRRTFLRRLLGVGGAAALVGSGVQDGADPASRTEASEDETRGGTGYRLTAHIRRYYERAGS